MYDVRKRELRHNVWTSEGKCCVSVDKELAGENWELNRERVWLIAVCDCTVGTVYSDRTKLLLATPAVIFW